MNDLSSEGIRISSVVSELDGFEDVEVTYLRSIYVPDDEVSFCLFRSPSAEAVAEGFERANVAYDRILEAEVLEP